MPNENQKPKVDAEVQRQKKEEKSRAVRRRNRQFIGLALSILIVVGAVSIVMNGIQLVQNMFAASSDEMEEYETLYKPLVWFEIIPFESVSQLDENSIKQACIWGIVSQNSNSLNRNERGEALVPSSMVDQYGVQLFGPDFRFSSHASFADPTQGLTYSFDDESGAYTVPVTGLDPAYVPKVVDIVRESGGVKRVVVGYVSTRTSDDQVVMELDYDHPAFYMDYMLRRDGSEYYLFAMRRNTTHVVLDVPVSSSLPAASSSTSEVPAPVAVPQDPSGSRPEDSSVDDSMPEDSSADGSSTSTED